MLRIKLEFLVAITILIYSLNAQDDIIKVVTEKPGSRETTVALDDKLVETFDGFTVATYSSQKATFGSKDGSFHGTFKNIRIKHTNIFGGSGTSGSYAASDNTTFTKTLRLTLDSPTNYIGFYLAPGKSGQIINIFNPEGLLFFTFDFAKMISTLSREAKIEYLGNRSFLPQTDLCHYYFFLNFLVLNERKLISAIEFGPVTFSGFQIDNVTIGNQKREIDDKEITTTPQKPTSSSPPVTSTTTSTSTTNTPTTSTPTTSTPTTKTPTTNTPTTNTPTTNTPTTNTPTTNTPTTKTPTTKTPTTKTASESQVKVPAS